MDIIKLVQIIHEIDRLDGFTHDFISEVAENLDMEIDEVVDIIDAAGDVWLAHRWGEDYKGE